MVGPQASAPAKPPPQGQQGFGPEAVHAEHVSSDEQCRDACFKLALSSRPANLAEGSHQEMLPPHPAAPKASCHDAVGLKDLKQQGSGTLRPYYRGTFVFRPWIVCCGLLPAPLSTPNLLIGFGILMQELSEMQNLNCNLHLRVPNMGQNYKQTDMGL